MNEASIMHARRYDAIVVGLGQSGLACVRHLVAAHRQVAVLDTRRVPPMAAALEEDYPQVPLITGSLDDAWLARADEVVVSPGVDRRDPALRAAVDRGQPVIGEVELFARQVPAPVIAITGTNGKSTVTRMVTAMAQADGRDAVAGGNLGPAALDLLAARPDAGLYVLELSSFQLESIETLTPLVGAVLNLSADHLDRYDSMTDYAAAKARILDGAATAVLNADDPWVSAMASSATAVSWFGHTAHPHGDAERWRLAMHDGKPWFCRGDVPVMPREDLPLLGRHNSDNALAALAIGEAAGFGTEAMVQALRSFAGLAHRMEILGEYRDRLWVNDSKATNVSAAVAAVAGLERALVLIAGGDAKGQQFDALARVLADRARGVAVYGRDAPVLERALAGQIPLRVVADLATAVVEALDLSRPGDAILLSPACASLDQFRDYRARGECFRQQVEGLADG
jgi:UDP-N-acetylmuramoylalanine--D-glutamate ligase